MEALVILIIALASALLVDLAAINFGTDSRPSIGDDHRRPITF